MTVPNSILTSTRTPAGTDAPDIASIVDKAVGDLDDNVITGPFATTAARDTAFASWVAAGHTMRSGLLAMVTGSGIWEYDGAEWKPLRGLVAPPAVMTAQFNNTGTTEVAITGLLSTGIALRSGRCYRARLICRPWPGVSNVVMVVKIRVGAGTPTTGSTAVAAMQFRQSGNDINTAEDKDISGYFAVQTTGTFGVRAFGIVASGSFAVAAAELGRAELSIIDCGPAQSGLVTVI